MTDTTRKLSTLLGPVNRKTSVVPSNAPTLQEMKKSFEMVISLIEQHRTLNIQELNKIDGQVRLFLQNAGQQHAEALAGLQYDVTQAIASIPKVQDGYSPKKGVDYFDGVDGKPGSNGSPDSPQDVKKKLQSLQKKDRLHVSGVDGVEELIQAKLVGIRKGGTIGGRPLLQLLIGGAKKGAVQYINLIAGTNMTITHTVASGRNDILFDASGGGTGFTKLTATGTVNGNNAAFTFTQKPLYIIADGAWYQENKGWTYSGSTATLSVPPNADIYGFV